MATLKERVAERYPSLLALLKQPEIGSLLTQAVEKNWSPGVFQSKFIASNWFRRQSESQRRWWILSATDPGEANQQRRSMRASFGTLAASMGAQLNTAQINFLSESILQRGQDPNGPEARAAIAKLARIKAKDRYHVGAFQSANAAIEAMSEGEFFTPLNINDAAKYGRRVIQGTMSMDDVQTAMLGLAIKRFPHMREQLIQGMTPREIVAPYQQIVAEELELGNPDRVDVTRSSTWRQLLGIRDPKSNKMRLPTESEVVRMARSQPTWWKTSRGRQADAGMATALLKTFGKVA